MKVFPVYIDAGITGFESPAAEYIELGLSLDELLVQHPNATFIGIANGDSMQGVGIFNGDLLVVDRSEATKQGDIVVATYGWFCFFWFAIGSIYSHILLFLFVSDLHDFL